MIRVELKNFATRDMLELRNRTALLRKWCREALGKNDRSRGGTRTWAITTQWVSMNGRGHTYPVMLVRDEAIALACTLRWA